MFSKREQGGHSLTILVLTKNKGYCICQVLFKEYIFILFISKQYQRQCLYTKDLNMFENFFTFYKN